MSTTAGGHGRRTARPSADRCGCGALSLIATSRSGEACVLDVGEVAGGTQPTVSHHLEACRTPASSRPAARDLGLVPARLAGPGGGRAVLEAFAVGDAQPAS